MQTYHLSETQKAFYYYELMNGKTARDSHNMIIGNGYFDRTDSFDPDAIEKAYFEWLRRNDAFRMRFVGSRLFPKQVFTDTSEFQKPERLELKGGFEAFKKLCEEPTYPDITMNDEFLTKAIIYCCDDGTGGIVIWQHHICSDGYSEDDLGYKELCEFYACYKRGETPSEPKKIFSFAQCVESEQENLKGKKFRYLKWSLKEWNRNFFRYYSPKIPHGEKISVNIEIKGERYRRYRELCRERMCSSTQVFMTAMAVLTHQYYPEKRFNFLSETHGRMCFAQKNTCGPLLGEIPVFYEIRDTDTFANVLALTFAKMSEAYSYYRIESFAADVLCDFLVPHLWFNEGSGSWMLFNNQEDYHTDGDRPLELTQIKQPDTFDRLKVNIWSMAPEEGTCLEIVYPQPWADEEKICRLKKQYLEIFDALCNDPEKTVGACLGSLG